MRDDGRKTMPPDVGEIELARLHVLSDIHDDYSRASFGNWAIPRDVGADVVVVAGDIAGRLSRMGRSWIESQRRDVPMVVVPGNHDLWGASMDNELDRLRDRLMIDNVHVLDGDAVVLSGVRFVGGTLWTDYLLWNGDEATAAKAAARETHDFGYIRTAGGTRPVTPKDFVEVHRRQKASIESTLAVSFDGPTVVVTHHAPSARSLRFGRATQPLDAAFASDLEALIERGRPQLWVHGHIHKRQDYMIGDTRIVANPRGFIVRRGRGESAGFEREVPDFDERFVIEVGG